MRVADDSVAEERPLTLNESLDHAILAFGALAHMNESRLNDRLLVEELNESRDLDPSGVTTFMMLSNVMQEFTRNTVFSAEEIMKDPVRFAERIQHIRAVKAAIEHPDTVRVSSRIEDQLRTGFIAAGAGPDAVAKVIGEAGALGYVRRDALRSMARLEAHQFTYGVPDPASLLLNQTIYEFWNIHSLLSLLQRQNVAGVTLCLIRDPAQVMASYFVLAVKNGDTITVLTDREDVPHPAFHRMTRRPDRRLERRWNRHHFPYELLDLEVVDEGKDRHGRLRAKDRVSLVPLQQELVPLSKVGAMDPIDLAWLIMLHALVDQRYGSENHKLPALSYTGEMIRRLDALVAGTSALARHGLYQPLELPAIQAADVDARSTAGQWENPATGHNEWMMERYADQVADEMLNPVGEAEARLLEKGSRKALVSNEGKRSKPLAVSGLEAMNPMAFGTAEDLERDRLWVARVNQARIIQAAAEREYRATAKQTYAWLRKKLLARLPELMEQVIRLEVMLPFVRYNGWEREPFRGEENALSCTIGATTQAEADEVGWLSWGPHAINLGRFDASARFRLRCAFDEKVAANCFALLEPTCPEAIARLAGVEVEALPFGLRHWYEDAPYYGNSILQRLDPSDWALKNPWCEDRITVLIPFAKATYRTLCKKHDVAPVSKVSFRAKRTRPESESRLLG